MAASLSKRYRAYVQITAKLVRKAGENEPDCSTDWTLAVSTDYGATFNHFSAKPIDSYDGADVGNEFRILGWSADGNRLLATMIQWVGDYTRHTPILYDFRSNRLRKIDLKEIFRSVAPSDCNLFIEPVGFTSGNVLAVRAFPSYEDLEPGQQTCFAKSTWAVPLGARPPSRLPQNARVYRGGQISWTESKKDIHTVRGEGYNAINPLCAELLRRTQVDFTGRGEPYCVEWNRCGDPVSEKENEVDNGEHLSFPEHHLVIFNPDMASDKSVAMTLDNMPAYETGYYFEEVRIADLGGNHKQELFVRARYYGNGGGQAWCVLGQKQDSIGCLPSPDINAIARKMLHPDEDLCCTDWSVSLDRDHLTAQHEVFDKKTGVVVRRLELRIVLQGARLTTTESTH